MPLRIGFDLDGTLADMEGELIRQAEILFGESGAADHRLGLLPRCGGGRAHD